MRRSPCSRAALAAFIALAAACGDDKHQLASASATARPICKDSPATEYEPRCRDGERDCCALLVSGKDEHDPKNVDAFALACAGGHISACSVVRDADKPPAWKLDALGKACLTGLSDVTCRASTFLGFVVEPDKMAERMKTYYCDRRGGELLITSGQSLRCPTPDATLLATLKRDAVACGEGAFEHCKALTGVDGTSATLLRPVAASAWKARGIDDEAIEEVLDARILPWDLADAKPKGSVGVTVEKSAAPGAKPVDTKAVGDAIKKADDAVRKCIGFAAQKNEKPTKVAFDVVIDARGVIAATVDTSGDDQAAKGLAGCSRAQLQDVKVEGVKGPGRAHVTLALGP